MPCNVVSRVMECSAWNTALPSSRRVHTLVRITTSGQSASPIVRSEVTELLTLRLSAACSARCCSSTAGKRGNMVCSQVLTITRLSGKVVCRRRLICAKNTPSTPRSRMRAANSPSRLML